MKIKLRELREDDGPVLQSSAKRMIRTINYGKIKSSDKCQKYIYDSNLQAADNVILFWIINVLEQLV